VVRVQFDSREIQLHESCFECRVKGDDGSITIYIQATSPGKDRESNWLPAPDGPFWPVYRTYGPGEPLLDGTWKLPAIKKST
jgi:hypothetical protein